MPLTDVSFSATQPCNVNLSPSMSNLLSSTLLTLADDVAGKQALRLAEGDGEPAAFSPYSIANCTGVPLRYGRARAGRPEATLLPGAAEVRHRVSKHPLPLCGCVIVLLLLSLTGPALESRLSSHSTSGPRRRASSCARRQDRQRAPSRSSSTAGLRWSVSPSIWRGVACSSCFRWRPPRWRAAVEAAAAQGCRQRAPH